MLRELGVDVLAVEHRDLNGILASIGIVGEAVGRAAEAASLLRQLTARMDSIRAAVDSLPRPGVAGGAGS